MESKLPKVQDLYADIQVTKKNDSLMALMNQPVKADWVKTHPFIKGHKYLPIDKVEFLLKKIFKQNYRIEVLKTGMLLNAVEVTVRLHYKDVVSGDWLYHDGVAACELQTQKGTGPLKLDMSNVNTGALPMALPIAKSLAIKDAADMMGTIFGSDLNRKDTIQIGVDPKLEALDRWTDLKTLFDELTDRIPAKDFARWSEIIETKEEASYNKLSQELNKLCDTTKAE